MSSEMATQSVVVGYAMPKGVTEGGGGSREGRKQNSCKSALQLMRLKPEMQRLF